MKKKNEKKPDMRDFFHPDLEIERFGTTKTEKVDWKKLGFEV